MKHYFTASLFFLIFTLKFHAQQNTVSSGGDFTGTSGSVSFSIGQIDYLKINNGSGAINQGVQQPYQILDNSVNESDLNFNLTIGPNPSFDMLVVTADYSKMKNIEGHITDQNGKIVIEKQKLSINNTFDLVDLASGSYFLNIENDQKRIKSYKIIKN
jgi:hypothetical protein